MLQDVTPPPQPHATERSHAMSDSREWVSAARSTLGACRQCSTPPSSSAACPARSAASRSSATARPSSRSPSSATARSPTTTLPERADPILDRAVAQLEEYFAGHRHDFDLPRLARRHRVPARRVGAARRSSSGARSSPTASSAWRPGGATAGRAVGGAVGANPIPIIVPCHRVLGSDGRITGYSGGEGIPTKSWLLAHEGIAHTRARRRPVATAPAAPTTRSSRPSTKPRSAA